MERTSDTTPFPDMSGGLFKVIRISDAVEEPAPDGSRVRPLLSLKSGGMAQFELDTGKISKAVMHQSVEEIWLVLSGRGELWRKKDVQEAIVALEAGVCVSIPASTAFQFRCLGGEPLRIAAVTMPPWPGDDEAVVVVGRSDW